jgi:hypothetical protein
MTRTSILCCYRARPGSAAAWQAGFVQGTPALLLRVRLQGVTTPDINLHKVNHPEPPVHFLHTTTASSNRQAGGGTHHMVFGERDASGPVGCGGDCSVLSLVWCIKAPSTHHTPYPWCDKADLINIAMRQMHIVDVAIY